MQLVWRAAPAVPQSGIWPPWEGGLHRIERPGPSGRAFFVPSPQFTPPRRFSDPSGADYAILFAFMSATPPGTTAPPRPRALRDDDGRLLRGRRSRRRIREAARALFRERGFDATTLRAVAERAGMGVSSLYRHIQSKEELLVEELAELQEEAWRRFREADDRRRPTLDRLRRFLRVQHELLVADRDLTVVALRATTRPEARVARRALALHDRTIGLLAEILQMGRKSGDVDRQVDVLAAARALFHVTQGARIPWANGLIDADACLDSLQSGLQILFHGLRASASSQGGRAPAPTPGPATGGVPET
jgi:AcrR family transcriptional regulator